MKKSFDIIEEDKPEPTGLHKTYLKAIDSVIAGELSKDDLWDVFSENLGHREDENKRLRESLNFLRKKYDNLLTLVNDAHEEHKNLFND